SRACCVAPIGSHDNNKKLIVRAGPGAADRAAFAASKTTNTSSLHAQGVLSKTLHINLVKSLKSACVVCSSACMHAQHSTAQQKKRKRKRTARDENCPPNTSRDAEEF
ncbi:unnamed protein product, partial [Ectocarpus fasciculatus]